MNLKGKRYKPIKKRLSVKLVTTFMSVVAIATLIAINITLVSASTSLPTLSKWSNNTNVYALQYLLENKGYELDIDGSFGPGTLAIVKTFQAANKLVVDGVVGPNTWNKLLVTVKYGSKNSAVKAVQKILKNKGYSLTVDGSFGNATKDAILGFQKKFKLEVDGCVGSETWSYLLSDLTSSGKYIWRGNENTYNYNSTSRNGETPKIIVDHITADDSFSNCDSWFRSLSEASAHFMIDKDGTTYQYVSMERSAYGNGIPPYKYPNVTSSFVKSQGSKIVNSYSVSIEHVSANGVLTNAQIQSSIQLHKYIQSEVYKNYGYKIPSNRTQIIGHSQIDPVGKPNCPGTNFPWTKIINSL